jgi:hypothetical protein
VRRTLHRQPLHTHVCRLQILHRNQVFEQSRGMPVDDDLVGAQPHTAIVDQL